MINLINSLTHCGRRRGLAYRKSIFCAMSLLAFLGRGMGKEELEYLIVRHGLGCLMHDILLS
jgi:hypothetical protein